jgi:hypothetical protein
MSRPALFALVRLLAQVSAVAGLHSPIPQTPFPGFVSSGKGARGTGHVHGREGVAGSGRPLGGELIIYGGALSAAERQQVEQYLGAKHGIAVQ